MALAKTITFKGANLTYHKIGDLRLVYVAEKPRTEAGVLSYFDKAARDADAGNNIQGCYVMLDGVPPGDADARAWAYEQIVAQKEEWADAKAV